MHSSTPSAMHTPTAGEEEDMDHPRYRYIPRTLLQGRSFYEPAIYGLSGESSSSSNNYGTYGNSIKRTEHEDANDLQFDNLTGQYLNVPRVDLPEGISNDSDNAPQVPHSNNCQLPTRNLDLGDLDIKNIHGRNHHGKLETTPITDRQDRLWTQIDVLDDVKNMASKVDLYEDFQPDFEEQLSKLRLAHSQLLKTIRERDSLLYEQRKSDTGNSGDYVNNFDNGIRSATNRPGGNQMTGGTETNGPSDLTTASAIPVANPNEGAVNEGAVSNPSADASGRPTNSSKFNRLSHRPPTIETDEDIYVQDIVGIIKQLRV